MMKKTIFAGALCATLLFTGCIAENPTGSDSKLPETNNGIEQNDSASLPIDIEYVSYENDTKWKDMVVKSEPYDFHIPEGWIVIDGTEHGLLNGAFFVPPEADPDNFRFDCHIAIEIGEGGFYGGDGVPDYGLESTQKDFFASMIVSTFSKMGGLSDLEFSVWNLDNDYIYIVDFVRSNETLTMHQTTYYVMKPDHSIVVYATTFGEDAPIPVQEAACHLIASLLRI